MSIPIFTSQLEKSRDAASIANIRSAYAEASAALLTEDDTSNNVTFTKADGGAITKISVANVAIQTAQANDWSGNAGNLQFTVADPGGLSAKANKTVDFTVTNGQITAAAFAS